MRDMDRRGAGATALVLALGLIASCSSPQRAADGRRIVSGEAAVPCISQACAARHPGIATLRVVRPAGARPRWSPRGDVFVFDRKNADGFYDLYTADTRGQIVASLTENRPGIGRRNNGNGVFHPSGDFIVFVSETPEHYGMSMKWLGDPGLGLLSNLWATTPDGGRYWRLTDIPIKRGSADGQPAVGVVNPHFSRDGGRLIWTERYADGGHHNWGRWRIKTARFVVQDGQPRLDAERVLYTPQQGNYVTYVGELADGRLLVAGNLDGQHEYGMDQYALDPDSGTLTNLQKSPETWEEDACAAPNGDSFAYMTDTGARYRLNFKDPDWARQPRQREYWLMDAYGRERQQLTYFNDPTAPEYLGRRAIVAACDISPDGRRLAGTLGVDYGGAKRADIDLMVVVIEFDPPLR